MKGYAKFKKDLFTRNRTMSFEPIDKLDYFLISYREENDPGAFIILCTNRDFVFTKALYDLGTSINLMQLVVFR